MDLQERFEALMEDMRASAVLEAHEQYVKELANIVKAAGGEITVYDYDRLSLSGMLVSWRLPLERATRYSIREIE